MRVATPDGARDATARLVCAEPASAAIAFDATGGALLPEGCAKAKCTSDRWLAADVENATCKLGRAVALTVELPQGAKGTFVIRLEPEGGKRAAVEVTSVAEDGKPRRPIGVPPVPLGRYALSVRRESDAWVCRSVPPMRSPTAQKVSVPWKDPIAVRGRVLTPTGEPLPSMPVAAYPPPSLEDEVMVRLAPRGQLGGWTCGPVDGTSIRSQADGAFTVLVEPEADRLVVAGSWDDPRGIDFKVWRSTSHTTLELVPRMPWRLVARVLDQEERPVAGWAAFQPDGSEDGWAARVLPGSERKTTLGMDGWVRLGPSRAARFDVSIAPEDALPSRKGGEAPAGGTLDLGVIHVDRGATAKVEVRDEDDRPVAGAKVQARNGSGFDVVRDGRTGPDGNVTIRGLAREPLVDLEVRARGFMPQRLTGLTLDGPLRVRLKQGISVRGRVLAPDGQPILASVWATRDGRLRAGGAFTEENGEFEFGLPRERLELVASAVGFQNSQQRILDLTSGAPVEDLELVLEDPDSIRGIVLDPDRRPIAGATVSVVNGSLFATAFPPGAHAMTVSGSDGRFELVAAAGSMDFVVAQLSGYALAVGTPPDKGAELELQLGPAAALRVLLPSSVPPAQSLVIETQRLFREAIPLNGRAEITRPDLPAGPIGVSLGRFEKASTLIAGETVTVDLRTSGKIRGRVTRGGRGVARAVVVDSGSDSKDGMGATTVFSDADGGFVLEPVDAGVHRILAQASEGRAEQRVTVTAGSDVSATLELIDARVRVNVMDARSRKPLSGAKVVVSPEGVTCATFAEMGSVEGSTGFSIQTSDRGCAKSSTGSDGSALLSLPATGPYEAKVHAPGFAPWSRVVDLLDGTVDLRADLEPSGPGVVHVTLETETPGVEGSLYCVQGAVANSHYPAEASDVCEGFKPGRAEVAFRSPAYGAARAVVDVPEEGDVTVTLRVARGGNLFVSLPPGPEPHVAVLDADGVVWNQAQGRGWPTCGFAERRADEPVRYLCYALPPGPYTIRLEGRAHATAVVRPGETTTIE